MNAKSMGWRDMGDAPLDGTLVQLLVRFDSHGIEDTDEPVPTVGSHNDGEWNFVGWDWYRDEWTRGSGDLLGWSPIGPNARNEASAPVEALPPYTSELHFALREGHQIGAEDDFFSARPHLDEGLAREGFRAGFERGFDKATDLAADRAARSKPDAPAGAAEATLRIALTFDTEAGGEETCEIVAHGTEQDMKRLQTRINYWHRLDTRPNAQRSTAERGTP